MKLLLRRWQLLQGHDTLLCISSCFLQGPLTAMGREALPLERPYMVEG